MTVERMDIVKRDAHEFLEYLYNEYETFRDFIDSNRYREEWFRFKRDLWKTQELIRGYNGAFRAVILDDNSDWVIKMNFNEDEPGQCSEDGCEKEVWLYQCAIENNVEEYFAPCYYGGRFRGQSFYLMQRVCVDTEAIASDFDTNLREIDREYSGYDVDMYEDDIEAVVNVFGNYYSHEKVFKLLNFCADYNVYDLHEGNLGYSCDRPVIIDYASC